MRSHHRRLTPPARWFRTRKSPLGAYLAENHPVAGLIIDAGAAAEKVTDHGIAEFSVELGPGRPSERG